MRFISILVSTEEIVTPEKAVFAVVESLLGASAITIIVLYIQKLKLSKILIRNRFFCTKIAALVENCIVIDAGFYILNLRKSQRLFLDDHIVKCFLGRNVVLTRDFYLGGHGHLGSEVGFLGRREQFVNSLTLGSRMHVVLADVMRIVIDRQKQLFFFHVGLAIHLLRCGRRLVDQLLHRPLSLGL